MDEEKHIHWTELFGNRFRFAPHPLMMKPEGYQMRIATKIKGESRTINVPVVVTFDEQYVIQYLARTLELLRPQKYNDWQKIMSKAYVYWNEKESKQVQQ